MRILLILDLLTLLPLFLVGGSNAFWWVLATAGIGAIGVAFSLGNLRETLALAQSEKRMLNLPVQALATLGSILLILPGFISDLAGGICLVTSLVIARAKPSMQKQRHREQHYATNHNTPNSSTNRKGGRVIDIEYNEVSKDEPGNKT